MVSCDKTETHEECKFHQAIGLLQAPPPSDMISQFGNLIAYLFPNWFNQCCQTAACGSYPFAPTNLLPFNKEYGLYRYSQNWLIMLQLPCVDVLLTQLQFLLFHCSRYSFTTLIRVWTEAMYLLSLLPKHTPFCNLHFALTTSKEEEIPCIQLLLSMWFNC